MRRAVLASLVALALAAPLAAAAQPSCTGANAPRVCVEYDNRSDPTQNCVYAGVYVTPSTYHAERTCAVKPCEYSDDVRALCEDVVCLTNPQCLTSEAD